MVNQDNDDLDLTHKKIDLKQFSEMQAAITKEQLKDHLNTEFEKQKRAINKRNYII